MRLLTASVTLMLTAGLLASCRGGTPEMDPELAKLPVQPPGSVEEFVLHGESVSPVLVGKLSRLTHAAGDGYLAGPHFTVRIATLGVGDALRRQGDAPVLGNTARRAEPGQELLVFDVDSSARGGPWKLREDEPKPVAELVVNGAATKLDKLPLTKPAGRFDRATDGVAVVASVPTGAQVLLKVTDAQRTQTLDVRTGHRGPDAIGGYYRTNSAMVTWTGTTVSGGVTSRAGGRQSVTFNADYQVFNTGDPAEKEIVATVGPFHPLRGWAPDGRAWLVIEAPLIWRPFDLHTPIYHLDYDYPAVFSVVLPDGTSSPAQPGSKTITTTRLPAGPSGETPLVTFDVPADFRDGALRVDPGAATVTAGEATGQWSPAPAAFTVPFAIG